MSTGWITEVAIIPAAPPLMKGRTVVMAGCLKILEFGRAAERGAAAVVIFASFYLSEVLVRK
jgi:hypothetical protein